MNRRRIGAHALVILLVVSWTACVMPRWEQGAGEHTSEKFDVSLYVPEEWYWHELADSFLMTRDGSTLNRIDIERLDYGAKLAYTNRAWLESQSVQELAELRADSLRMYPDLRDAQVLEIYPTSLDGRDCYGLSMSWRTEAALPMRAREYGCKTPSQVYMIRYQAPASYYYEAGLETFERVSRSVRFLPVARQSPTPKEK